MKEMKRYNLSIFEVSEMRWNTFGSKWTAPKETILYSGKPNEDDPRVKAVGHILLRVATISRLSWKWFGIES